MVFVAQLVRASDCDSEGRRFDPDRSPHARMEELVVSLVLGTSGESRVGSSPTPGTNNTPVMELVVMLDLKSSGP